MSKTFTGEKGTRKLVELVLGKIQGKEEVGMEELDISEVIGDGSIVLGTTGFKGIVDEESNSVVLKKYIGSDAEVVVTPLYDVDGMTYNTKLADNSSHMFSDTDTLEKVSFAEGIDTSNITDMSYMFSNNINLISVDLSTADLSNVANTVGMFTNTPVLKEVKVNDTWNSDNESVDMFVNSGVDKVTLVNSGYSIPHGSMGNATPLSCFGYALSTTDVMDCEGNISPSVKVVSITNILSGLSSTSEIIIPPTYRINGEDLPVMISGKWVSAGNGNSILNPIFLNHGAKLVIEDGVILHLAGVGSFSADKGGILASNYLQSIYIGKVKRNYGVNMQFEMGYLFQSNKNKLTMIEGLVNLSPAKWHTEYTGHASVDSTAYMFNGFSGTALDMTGFNMEHIFTASHMFYNCKKLTTIVGVEDLNPRELNIGDSMFENCYALILPSLHDWNFTPTNTSKMFMYCSKISELILTGLDTAKNRNMSSMFNMCNNLRRISVSRSIWNIPGSCNTSLMFNNCGTDQVSYFDANS